MSTKTLASLITVFFLAGTLWLTRNAMRRIPEHLTKPLDDISTSINGWKAVRDERLDEGVLKKLAPTSYLSRTYEKDRERLDVFTAFYAQQRAGESMHSPKHCLPGAGWEIWRHDSALIPTSQGKMKVNKYSIQQAGTRMLMFYWYQSADRVVASEYLGKVLLARDTLLTGRTAGSIVRIMVRDTPQLEHEAVAFGSTLLAEVRRCFSGDSKSGPPQNSQAQLVGQ
jgi:EpsI family protein